MTTDNVGAEPPVRVLHVCTGNICRSPMAERIMRAEVASRFGPDTDLVVSSAGTYGGHHGQPMHDSAVRALRSMGVDSTGFTATWLRESQLGSADLVLTATAEHRSAVLRLEPRALKRTFTLRELARLAVLVPPEQLPAGSPGVRLRAVVRAAADLRGLHPPAQRGADDIEDPFGLADEQFAAAAASVAAAVRTIVGVL